MSQNQQHRALPVPVDDLDLEAIGRILVNLGAAAALAGHARPSSTVDGYCRIGDDSSDEIRFVRDLFKRTTPEIAEEWYGGELEATARATYAVADSLAP